MDSYVEQADDNGSGEIGESGPLDVDGIVSCNEAHVVNEIVHASPSNIEDQNVEMTASNAVDRNLDEETNDMERELNNPKLISHSRIVDYPSTSDGKKE